MTIALSVQSLHHAPTHPKNAALRLAQLRDRMPVGTGEQPAQDAGERAMRHRERVGGQARDEAFRAFGDVNWVARSRGP